MVANSWDIRRWAFLACLIPAASSFSYSSIDSKDLVYDTSSFSRTDSAMKRSMYRWDGSPSKSRDENTAVALGGGIDERVPVAASASAFPSPPVGSATA